MRGSVLARGAALSGRTSSPTRNACSTQVSVDKNVGPEETEESVKKIGTFWRDVANARNNEAPLYVGLVNKFSRESGRCW